MDDVTVDINQRERLKHGTESFPFAFYQDRYYNSSYPWHWHEELEIGYSKKGKTLVEVNKNTYVIEEGNGIFINSGTLHALAGKGNTEVLFPNILFQASLVYGSSESVFYKKYMQKLLAGEASFVLLDRKNAWQQKVLELLEESVFTEKTKTWGYEFRIRELVTKMVLLILEHCGETQLEPLTDKKGLWRIRRMMDYIREHYGENISLQDIAASASIGERECLRCFQEYMKKSPKQYVIEMRICNARKLLASTSLSMREIGELCGFQDASYFSKVFRDYNGMSPREYQQKLF